MSARSSVVSGKDLAKALKGVFASSPATASEATSPFLDLAPPRELLDLIDAYIVANHGLASTSAPSASSTATLAETLLELSALVARGKERGETVGRTSAWLIVLARLVNSGVEALPRSAVGSQLWPTLLRRALLTPGDAIITLSREGVQAIKDLLAYAFESPDAADDALSSFEEEVLAEYLDATTSTDGESDLRRRQDRGRERGAAHLEDVLVALGWQRPKVRHKRVYSRVLSSSPGLSWPPLALATGQSRPTSRHPPSGRRLFPLASDASLPCPANTALREPAPRRPHRR
jgi:hypothetical protein